MQDRDEKDRVDPVALLYVLGGIPAMVTFFVLIFVGVKVCGIPA